MQDNPVLLVQPQTISFGEFLMALFAALDKERVRFCVLRNYEGFPYNNVGCDLDLLIFPFDLPGAVHALSSIQGIRLVGYAERYYVAHAFVEGVSPVPGIRSFAVDFTWSLNWKGLPYLPTNIVLREALSRQAVDLNFLIPSPIHEAIISLLSSLLVGGRLKEKYYPKVQETYTNHKSAVITALLPSFGLKAATRLVDSVIGGDRGKILSCVSSLRVSLVLRNLLRGPVHSILGVARYYAYEVVVRCTPKTLEAVRISDPDGCCKATIIDSLMPLLRYSAKLVERRHFAPQFTLEHEPLEKNVRANPRAGAICVPSVSMAKIARWLLEEWLSQFRKRQNLTLRIIESSYYDLLIDSGDRRNGIPRWFARLIGKLFPSPDLWILLDVSAKTMQSISREFLSAGTLKQREAYRSFVKTRKRYIILDAEKPPASVAEEAYAAIIDTLALRTARQLRNRF